MALKQLGFLNTAFGCGYNNRGSQSFQLVTYADKSNKCKTIPIDSYVEFPRSMFLSHLALILKISQNYDWHVP